MKQFILFIVLFYTTSLFAQTPEDAIRNSFYPQNGTARNNAIGGAMVSLGGDITATFVNPAGLGFYKTNELVLSPAFLLNSNKFNYFSTTNKSSKNALSFGTSGWVWGFSSKHKKNISNAISLAVTQTANFNNNFKYSGLNNYSSFAEQFAEEFAKSGLTIDQALNANSQLPYGSAPALYTYLIDTIKVNGTYQVKAVPEYLLDAGVAVKQEINRSTSGGISEFALAFAHNNNDKWFWGVTVGIPIVRYNSNTIYKESDTSNKTANSFKDFTYTDNYSANGGGVNAKFGIIYRPKEYIRIGFALHTPTLMGITEKRTTSIQTNLEKPYWRNDTTINASSTLFTNGAQGENLYYQTTPLKAIISASYVFREVSNVKKQKGFISADVEYVSHNSSTFNSQNDNQTTTEKNYYKDLTSAVNSAYKGALNLKIGGELKFNTLMGRLGFAYYGNPYKNVPYKANRMLFSGGLGYRNNGMFIDLTYVHTITNDIDLPYRLEDRTNNYASVKQQRGNLMATIGIKF